RRRTAAFVLKGRAKSRPMTFNHHLGKNNDQIVRLAGSSAEVLIVQHSHDITDPVRATLIGPAFRPNSTYKSTYARWPTRARRISVVRTRIKADLGGQSAEPGRVATEDMSMVAFTAYEGLLSWLFLHLLLIAIPAVAGFLVGRRGRLKLWHVAALVLLTALLLLPAVACVDLNSRPEAWFSVMRMHASGSPRVSLLGPHA